MKRRSLIQFLGTLFWFGAFSAPKALALQNSPHGLTEKPHGAIFQAPGRRGLLAEGGKLPNTALVAAFDGTIHLMELGPGAMKPLWSFSSGPQIYSSYQSPSSDNVSDIGSRYFIDCGDGGHQDEWGLYAYIGNNKVKLGKSLEEYISSTPQIGEDGGIVLGSKKTTAFLVDARTGRIIYTYKMSDSPMTTQNSSKDFPYTNTVKESDRKTDEIPLYITRTDYELTSFVPNSNEVMWNVSVAEIGAAFLCQEIEKSLGGTSSMEASEPDLPYNMPLPCQSRVLVYHVRHHSEALSMPKMLPKANYQDLMLPGFRSDILPSQPNAEEVFKLLPSSRNSDRIVDAQNNDLIALPSQTFEENYGITRMQSWKVIFIDGLITVLGKLSTDQLGFVLSFVLLFAVYLCYLLLSRIKVESTTGLSAMNAPSKKKKSRKSGKGGSKMEKEENEVMHTDNSFWSKLNQPTSVGRTIGKLCVSNTEIAKGSNGTIVLEGIYEGRPVAVKRLVRAYNDIAIKEIQNLIVSDRHPNIVRWYGVEQDQDFVYLALERCRCNLNDLIVMDLNLDSMKGFMQDFVMWNSDGYPTPLLLKLMRDVISGIAHLHELGIVHRDLKPQNVLIIKEGSLCAKLSDMGISKRLVGDMSALSNHATGCGSSGWQAPEQLLHGRQTRAVDLYSLGCVLFFCITGGRHPFGSHLERDVNITKNKVDLFLVEHIPEAVDLFLQLLDPNAEMRPKAVEVLYHPLFWSAEMRLSFLRDTSDRVELEDRETDSDLLKALESIAPVALGGKWNEKMEPSFLNNIGRYRRYKFDSVRDLLRVMRNKLNHYRELPVEIQEIIGPVPKGFDRYFTCRFPKLLIEVYKVMHKHCRTEESFAKYFSSMEL